MSVDDSTGLQLKASYGHEGFFGGTGRNGKFLLGARRILW